MNLRQTVCLIVAAVAFSLFLQASPTGADVPPPRPGQPHPDIFQAAGFGNLQLLNPVTVKVKAQRTASYRVLIVSGCQGASQYLADLTTLEGIMLRDFKTRLVRNDAAPDFTIRLNCGTAHSQVCGSINIFCLGRGFPYVADVDISDIMYSPATWPYLSRIGVLCHEICGHAAESAEEQYCKGISYPPGHPCQGLPQFTSTPGWTDIMNTGPLSRHEPGDIEKERWSRIMFNVLEEPGCAGEVRGDLTWDNCLSRWVAPDGRRYDPIAKTWELPNGALEWSACAAWGGRFNPFREIWMPVGHAYFSPERGFWTQVPPC